METLDIAFVPDDGSKLFTDIKQSQVVQGIRIAVLDKGMASGLPSIMMLVGSDTQSIPFVVQTSARLFCSMARAIEAKYPDLFKDN